MRVELYVNVPREKSEEVVSSRRVDTSYRGGGGDDDEEEERSLFSVMVDWLGGKNDESEYMFRDRSVAETFASGVRGSGANSTRFPSITHARAYSRGRDARLEKNKKSSNGTTPEVRVEGPKIARVKSTRFSNGNLSHF